MPTLKFQYTNDLGNKLRENNTRQDSIVAVAGSGVSYVKQAADWERFPRGYLEAMDSLHLGAQDDWPHPKHNVWPERGEGRTLCASLRRSCQHA